MTAKQKRLKNHLRRMYDQVQLEMKLNKDIEMADEIFIREEMKSRRRKETLKSHK